MRAWVAGASGYIGRALVRELIERGVDVTALVRPGSAAAGSHAAAGSKAAAESSAAVRTLEVDVTDPAAVAARLHDEPVDAVFSCLASRSGVGADAWAVDHRANVALLEAATRAGARHFVLLSAICVQRPSLEFQRAKLAFERELAASSLAWSIVRPTAFFKSLAGQVERVRAGRPFLIFGDGRLTACKPIGEADLARYLADCVDDPARTMRVLPIGGPGPAITPREQGELLCRLAGVPLRLRSVPVRIFDVAGAILAPLGRLSPRLAGKAELARIGRYYATESMLLWDESAQRYDAAATPETGSETLEAFYERVLRDGLEGQELGAAKVF